MLDLPYVTGNNSDQRNTSQILGRDGVKMISKRLTKVLYGAAYYSEYQPYERLDEDFALMKEGGLSVIRVGESVWGTWEPEEGKFNLEWMQPILDRALESDISVILGTPTYAVPSWLFRKFPEIVAQRSTGKPIAYGHRQNVDYSNPTFLYYAERVIRKIVERYVDHPAIIGWQVDNEPGTEILHNPNVFDAFVKSLEMQYGDVENLNKSWGLTYWSHRINTWDELWIPDGNTNPSYQLAWRKFQARITTDFIDWQRSIVRPLIPAHHFITTCVAQNRPGQDVMQIGEALDVTAVNVYYATQDGLSYPRLGRGPDEQIAGPLWVKEDGAAAVHFQADVARAIRQENFLVTETNAFSTGHGSAVGIFPPYPGQLKQVALALISRGAQMVEYWHWNTLHYGTENYWGGVLGHSLKPARTFESFKDTSETLNTLGDELVGLTPQSPVAMILSSESRWALEFQPTLRDRQGVGDTRSYDRILHAFYGGFFANGLSVNFYGDSQLPSDPKEFLARHPILCLPSYYISNENTLNFVIEYARIGGHVILTPRTGYADSIGVIRTDEMPGVLREAAGVRYSEYSNLTKPVKIVTANGSPLGSELGTGFGWIDSLVSEGAEVLASYEHPFFSTFAAVTTNEYGKGRVTYVGSIPDGPFAKALGKWCGDLIERTEAPYSTSESVTVNSAKSKTGQNLHFIFNWSWTEAEVFVPFSAADLGSNNPIDKGKAIRLSPWGVAVIAEK